jgi:hypothetical protein
LDLNINLSKSINPPVLTANSRQFKFCVMVETIGCDH